MIHFYCFHSDKKIIATDYPLEKVRKRFGHRYEILSSIKDKDSFEVVKTRIQRAHPNYIIEPLFKKIYAHSEETKRKISLSKIGRARDEATREKISKGLKGRSNFQGKKHREESKRAIAEKKYGNDHAKDRIWVHDPKSDKEKRVKTRLEVPEGFSIGRDYYSTEPGLYYFRLRRKE